MGNFLKWHKPIYWPLLLVWANSTKVITKGHRKVQRTGSLLEDGMSSKALPGDPPQWRLLTHWSLEGSQGPQAECSVCCKPWLHVATGYGEQTTNSGPQNLEITTTKNLELYVYYVICFWSLNTFSLKTLFENIG